MSIDFAAPPRPVDVQRRLFEMEYQQNVLRAGVGAEWKQFALNKALDDGAFDDVALLLASLSAEERTAWFTPVNKEVHETDPIIYPGYFIFKAIETGRVDLVRLLLEAGASANAPNVVMVFSGFSGFYPQDEFGNTPLIHAIRKRQENVVRFLIDWPGVDINAEKNPFVKHDPDRNDPDFPYLTGTALTSAIETDFMEAFLLLINAPGIELAASESLWRAMKSTNVAYVRWLVQLGILPTEREVNNCFGWILRQEHYIPLESDDTDASYVLLHLVLSAVARVPSSLLFRLCRFMYRKSDDFYGQPQLYGEDGTALIQLCVEKGADPNEAVGSLPGRKGTFTALQAAIWAGRYNAVKYLVECGGANPAGTGSGPPPLFFSAELGRGNLTRLFLQRRPPYIDALPPPNVSRRAYHTPLTACASHYWENRKTIRADMAGRDFEINQVPENAVLDETWQVLLEYGANPDTYATWHDDNDAPHRESIVLPFQTLLLCLKRTRIDVSELAIDKIFFGLYSQHATALHIACITANAPLATALLARGADPHAMCRYNAQTMTLLERFCVTLRVGAFEGGGVVNRRAWWSDEYDYDVEKLRHVSDTLQCILDTDPQPSAQALRAVNLFMTTLPDFSENAAAFAPFEVQLRRLVKLCQSAIDWSKETKGDNESVCFDLWESRRKKTYFTWCLDGIIRFLSYENAQLFFTSNSKPDRYNSHDITEWANSVEWIRENLRLPETSEDPEFGTLLQRITSLVEDEGKRLHAAGDTLLYDPETLERMRPRVDTWYWDMEEVSAGYPVGQGLFTGFLYYGVCFDEPHSYGCLGYKREANGVYRLSASESES
jgi:hypothetical protein